jgi:hypothetical protein
MPAHPDVNRRLKRDRLPADDLMMRARDRIETCWDSAYRQVEDDTVPARFVEEARVSLPGLAQAAGEVGVDDVFDAMRLQKVRLRFNQQAPEWGS